MCDCTSRKMDIKPPRPPSCPIYSLRPAGPARLLFGGVGDVVSVLAALPPEKEEPTDSTDSDVVSVLAALPPDVWKGCAFPGASALFCGLCPLVWAQPN
jgi:hypothetical protein